MGRSNCSRVFVYSAVMRSACLAHAGRDRAHRGGGALARSSRRSRHPRRRSPSTSLAGDVHAVELEARLGDAGRRVLALARDAVRASGRRRTRRWRRRHRSPPARGPRSATSPAGTQVFTPSSTQPSPSARGGRGRVQRVARRLDQRRGEHRVAGDDARQVAAASGRRCRTAAIGSAPSTRVGSTGTGATVRPTCSSSRRRARRSRGRSPPCVLGQRDAEQSRPRRARPTARGRSRSSPASSSLRRSCVDAVVEDLARPGRAIASCSSSSEKSMRVLASAVAHAGHAEAEHAR